MLYSQTEPVIESSRDIHFFGHQYTYEEMIDHMRLSNLSLWNNKWTEVFDFTP